MDRSNENKQQNNKKCLVNDGFIFALDGLRDRVNISRESKLFPIKLSFEYLLKGHVVV